MLKTIMLRKVKTSLSNQNKAGANNRAKENKEINLHRHRHWNKKIMLLMGNQICKLISISYNNCGNQMMWAHSGINKSNHSTRIRLAAVLSRHYLELHSYKTL